MNMKRIITDTLYHEKAKKAKTGLDFEKQNLIFCIISLHFTHISDL